MEGTEYITLKEAAELSGYSPDYLGQLIRCGKIPGKQVYANVAWVTTTHAVSAYISRKEKKDGGTNSAPDLDSKEAASFSDSTPSQRLSKPKVFQDVKGWESFFRIVAFVTIGISTLFLLLLLYIFSTLIDHELELRTLRSVPLSTLDTTLL